jgi:AcrR family transcriptional regulator
MTIAAAQEVELGISERKGRERVEREQRIVASARSIAEAEGWAAVTIRRLAEEVEYSQPVLYSHFENRDAIVAAVAIEGFREIAIALQQAARRPAGRGAALRDVAMAYLAFAREHPAVYEAMFAMRTNLHFAEADTKSELRDGFAALMAVVAPSSSDAEIATETFWAALHGLAELERSGRIRPSARSERITLLCGLFER